MTYKTNEKCIRYKKRKNDFIDRKSISTALLGKIEYEIPTAAAEDTISDFKGFIHWCQQITLCLKLLNVIAGLFFLKGRYCIWLSSRRHHLIFQQKTTRRADGWRRVTRNSRNIFSLSTRPFSSWVFPLRCADWYRRTYLDCCCCSCRLASAFRQVHQLISAGPVVVPPWQTSYIPQQIWFGIHKGIIKN